MPNTCNGYVGTSKLSGGVEVITTVAYSAVDISAGSCVVMQLAPGGIVARVAVREDRVDHTRVGDGCEHAKRCAATLAKSQVNFEHPTQSLHPAHGGDRLRFPELLAAFGRWRCRWVAHNMVTILCVGREQAMVAHQMDTRTRLPETARRAMKSSGSNSTWVVPSRKGFLSSMTTSPSPSMLHGVLRGHGAHDRWQLHRRFHAGGHRASLDF